MIRIFVGCGANNEDLESQAVLEYSLRLYSSEKIEIEWMRQSRDPKSFWSGWNTTGWTTPFSGFRWGIPERCNYTGRAIYLDSDMIALDDIGKLWKTELQPKKAVVSKGKNQRFCTTLFDCAKVKPVMLPFRRLKMESGAYRLQRGPIEQVTQPFPDGENWNCLDGEDYESLDDPRIKILHYTAIDSQPQLAHALKRLEKAGQEHWFKGKPVPHWRSDVPALFDRMLKEAIFAGFRPENYEVEPFGRYAAGTSDGGSWKRGTQHRARGR